MQFRSKSPERMLTELSELTKKYGITSFEAVDNILDMKYVRTLFSRIEQERMDYRFFYEVKANLTRAQVQALHRGGVRRIQPGIESMSTRVLHLMRKGCSMLQNVVCLKWCRYYGIRVSWNLIWGFPGETCEDYESELSVLQAIGHLEPPASVGRIWLERFSPYFSDQNTFPLRNVRPEASYNHVYPPHVDLARAAYFFDYDMSDTVSPDVHLPTENYVAKWRDSWESSSRHSLTFRHTNNATFIDYDWGGERHGTYKLTAGLALIYESCVETMHTVEYVVNELGKSPDGYKYSMEEVREAMDEFCRAKLMITEGGRYLALAIPSNPNW